MHDELIYQFATTEDDQEAYELLLLLIAYYLTMYEDERDAFAERYNVNIESKNDSDMEEEYALYLSDIFMGMRERALKKKEELSESEMDEKAFLASMHEYVDNQFTTIDETESNDATQLALLFVAWAVQDLYSSAKVTKTWIAYPDCCDVCQVLNGTTKPLNEPFLVNGQVVELSDGKEFIYNYIPKYVAVAHPNCRCRIEINIEH